MAHPTHVALLRGVNVGGARKLPMVRLREELTAAGFEGVQTYVQSGNIVLAPESADPEMSDEAMAARIRKVIGESFELDVPVVVRTAAQLAAISDANPFVGIDEVSNTQLHVAFLERLPDRARVAALDPDRAPPDKLHVSGTEVFAYCPNGIGRSKVFVGLERALGTTATVRNWNTVTALLAMCRTGGTD